MMGTYSFTAPGQPIPKGRPRHNTKTGNTYTPKRTTDAEQNLGLSFRQQVVGYGPPRTSRFSLSCDFYVSRDIADIDNLIKTVMDGLQGFVWVNDKQVKRIGPTQVFIDRTNPRTVVRIVDLDHV